MADAAAAPLFSRADRPSSSPAATARVPVDRAALTACDDVGFWSWAARNLPGGTPFIEWDFLDLQERVFGIEIERYCVMANGTPIGIIPIARSVHRSLQSPWVGFPYLGPAVELRALGATLKAVRRYQWRTGLPLTHLDLAPPLSALGSVAIKRALMHERRDGTVQIDLTHGSEEELDARMGKSRRRLIKRAVQNGVEARTARPGEVSDLLGGALRSAYARRNSRNPYPERIGPMIEQWASNRPEVLLSVAVRDDEVLSADVTLAHHRTAVAWLGARSPDARSGDADAVLTRHVLLELMRSGHGALDLGGRVDHDVERYKLSFGGRTVPYSTVESLLGPMVAVDLIRGAANLRRKRGSARPAAVS